MTYQDVQKIRHLLKKTWKHFFRPFKGRLFPVQVKAIPLILSGNNIIIQSPTASGKTEAIMAPIIERLLKSTFTPPAIMYICPTRALVYDIYERLAQQVADLDLTMAIRTGEIRQFKPTNPQDILLTTPESLDSMLCRNKESLESIEYMVLDELHLLHGTYRGDQLRMDLIRLQNIAKLRPQYCALSATFKDPQNIASLYFSPFQVVNMKGQRELEYELIEYTESEQFFSGLLRYFQKKEVNKIIFFCNSRKETEEIAQILQSVSIWPKDSIFVHHGSLGKYERLATERALKTRRNALCTSTMSLEVGIDVGDIDLIVLIRPPPSVSSLLQRIGRGNRRENVTRAVGLFKNEIEEEEFQNLFDAAIKGELEEIEGGPCFSVAVQQIFSQLYKERFQGLNEKNIVDLLRNLPMEESQTTYLLRYLENKGYVEFHRQRWYPSVKTIDLGEHGFIHSNIPGTLGFNVINETTGKSVGEIATFDQINKNFVLSGQRWEVISIEGDKIKVTQSKDSRSKSPFFTPAQKHGRYFNLLPPQLKIRCCKQIQIS